MEKRERYFHPAVYWGMAIYMVLAYPVLALGDKIVGMMIPEDHYFENVGALSLFVASLLFFYCFVRAMRREARDRVFWVKKLVYLALALLFFFGAGEEISWGQRILHIATPVTLADTNTQDELNVHNLNIFEKSHFFTVDRLFDIFWFLFAVAVPGAALALPRVRALAVRSMPVVPWGLGALFLWDYALAKVAKTLFAAGYTYAPIPLRQAVQEIKESNYSVLFVLAGMFAVWQLRRSLQERE
ncbi:MAG: hypothetical protein ACM3QS_08565 [Bacteroidota bacterium]